MWQDAALRLFCPNEEYMMSQLPQKFFVTAATVFGLFCQLAQGEPQPDELPAAGAAQAELIGTPARPSAGLVELEGMGLNLNPRLARAAFVVAAARGKAIQAGLYPNPSLAVTFDELGDRTGRSGVNTLPLLSQELVTGGKLRLSREAGLRLVDQETWRLMSQRYALLADIRTRYYEALVLQSQIGVLQKMVALAERSVKQSEDLLEAKEVARLDVIQLEIEAERLKTELEASQRQLPASYKNLAVSVGDPRLVFERVEGEITGGMPFYDLEAVQAVALSSHPDIHAARHGVERARLLVERARVEPLPNVAVDTGYVRQNQNRSDDFRIGASMTVPLWNRNQGNIRAAEAEFCEAQQQVRQVENELAERIATAIREYEAARRRAERYSSAILPRARETYELSRKAYQGGEFEYLRILESQRALAQAYLDYTRALGEGWKAAAALSGLTLQDVWPDHLLEIPEAAPPGAPPEMKDMP